MRGGLNPEQSAAVAHEGGPLLVLAGAGTGKTRVLVNRIAHLVDTGAEPWSILAVTFTNKAAGEMRERLRQLLGPAAEPMWIGTFHATCARLLRRWGEKVGLTRSFAIFDDDDQMKLVNRLLKDGGLEDQVSPRTILSRIDRAKNAGLDPAAVRTGHYADDIVATVYPLYQAQLARENAVDFNDLLLFVLRLTLDPAVGPRLASTFRHVLVDEFQDTNKVQYDLVRALAGTRNLTVVGDDDQSIYGWRGAEPRNLLDFQRDFPDAVLVKLEQNYRSTQVILDAANGVIALNQDRLGKSLWTDRAGGDPIELVQTRDERAEGWQVASAIRRMIDDGPYSPRDFAVLYRTNAQSRVIEEYLRAHKVPAKVVGAVSFFERKEVKDSLAYLRLVANPNADSAFERVVNVPSRGIGEATVDRLRGAARADGSSLLVAARRAGQGEVSGLTPAARKKLAGFVEVVDGLRAVVDAGASIAEVLIQTVERSGLRARLEADDSPESRDRLANLAELVTIASDYDDETTEEAAGLDGFLERIALATPADERGATSADGTKPANTEAVTLMTVHIAKGLEFPIVFITGLEDGLFPSLREREEQDERAAMEEERRLAYVAMTRARERLILSFARERRVWGEIRIQAPSRFLDDIPPACLAQPLRPKRFGAGGFAGGSGPVAPPKERSRKPRPQPDDFDQRSYDDDVPVFDVDADLSDDDGFEPGATVSHAALGTGRIVGPSGSGRDRRWIVEFETFGRKTVQAKWLERV
jgi:DNA helicase-2/ATP-dependent DNA helicase PcrA